MRTKTDFGEFEDIKMNIWLIYLNSQNIFRFQFFFDKKRALTNEIKRNQIELIFLQPFPEKIQNIIKMNQV